VVAIFSEAMRPNTLNASTFKLFRRGSANPLKAQLSYYQGEDRALLNPEQRLKRGASYRLVVTTQARDLAGNRLDQELRKRGNQR
jgi:hypothetical protein